MMNIQGTPNPRHALYKLRMQPEPREADTQVLAAYAGKLRDELATARQMAGMPTLATSEADRDVLHELLADAYPRAGRGAGRCPQQRVRHQPGAGLSAGAL